MIQIKSRRVCGSTKKNRKTTAKRTRVLPSFSKAPAALIYVELCFSVLIFTNLPLKASTSFTSQKSEFFGENWNFQVCNTVDQQRSKFPRLVRSYISSSPSLKHQPHPRALLPYLGSTVKESTCNAGDAGDAGSILGLGKSPEGGHSNPLQYSCPENLMNRGDWQPTQSIGSQRVGHNWVTEHTIWCHRWGFLGGSVGKESANNAGDTRDAVSIPGSGRFPRGGHGNPLQYSWKNPMDRGARQATQSMESQTVKHNWRHWTCTHNVISTFILILVETL